MTGIIGINAYHADASAAFVAEGKLVAAAEEERFNRIKHSAGFPAEALRYVARAAGAEARDVAILAVARDPWARLMSKLWHGLRLPANTASRIKAQVTFASIGERAAEALGRRGHRFEVHRVEHHLAHMASAFFVSPFDAAALFSVDGLGDFASTRWGVGRGNRIETLGAVTFPHSLGLAYTALTQYLGFPKYGDEYKVMGLASYGEPEFLDLMREVIVSPRTGQIGFELARDFFTHHRSGVATAWESGEPMVGRIFSDGLIARLGKPRAADEPIESRHRNIAASLQARLDEVVLECLRDAYRRVSQRESLPGALAQSARLREDLELDSYAAIELIFELEDKVGVRIPSDAAVTFRTVDDVVTFVVAELSAGSAPMMHSVGGAGAA